MPLDPRIALMVNPPKPFDVIGPAMAGSRLQGEALNRKAQEMEIAAAERAGVREKGVQEAIARQGGDIEAALPEITQADPRAGLELRKTISSLKDDELQQAERKLKMSGEQIQRRAQLLAEVKDEPGYQQVLATIAQEDPAAARKMPPRFNPQYVAFQVNRGKTLAQRATEAHNAAMEEIGRRNAAASETRAQNAARPIPGRDVPLPVEVAEQQRQLRAPQRAPVPGVDAPLSPEVEAQRKRLSAPPPRELIPGRDIPLPAAVEAQRSRMNAQRAEKNGLNPGQFQRVQMLASQFDSRPSVKAFEEQAEKAKTVKNIISLGVGGPGDLALVFEFMRGLDPTSVVRESEYATAAKSGNIFKGWAAKFNGYLKPEGGFLPKEVGQSFSAILDQKVQTKGKDIEAIRKDYARRIDKITGNSDGEEYLTNYTELLTPKGAGPDLSKVPTEELWRRLNAPR